jgi:hypothetical protein
VSEELFELKLKVKVTLEEVMKVHRAGRSIALLFLEQGIRWGWMGKATSQQPYPL